MHIYEFADMIGGKIRKYDPHELAEIRERLSNPQYVNKEYTQICENSKLIADAKGDEIVAILSCNSDSTLIVRYDLIAFLGNFEEIKEILNCTAGIIFLSARLPTEITTGLDFTYICLEGDFEVIVESSEDEINISYGSVK
ncbi:hypothetical protein HYV12_03520 [Candidatus Dojkabacteria bacterium]|nr:hypothetical protein [Candidatus Dojkabacteria bacterium]